ncbi:MAG TPA: FYDLN acid domain-containing protein [Thermoanaerobaculia bacterium]|nr:FYDLN acid domain-containing protein [Thermoanaerobaculia bacterium]
MPELGKKYECAECGTKFYDLGKPEPICPKCGTNQRGLVEREKTVAPAPRPRPAAVVAPTVEVPDDELPADIGDEDEEILEVVPGEEEEEEEEDDEA